METDKVLARSYRSRPTVWLNSATVGNPAAGREVLPQLSQILLMNLSIPEVNKPPCSNTFFELLATVDLNKVKITTVNLMPAKPFNKLMSS